MLVPMKSMGIYERYEGEKQLSEVALEIAQDINSKAQPFLAK